MNSATNPLISLSQVSKKFGARTVIRNLCLTVEKGQCVGLLGPNGAGKSTLMKMLLGHLRAESGTIHILGHNMAQTPQIMRRKIGVVAQFDSLDPDFTVEENLVVYARYFGITRTQLMPRLNALLDFAMLESRRHDPISALSGGMKRRLSIARALVHQPPIILLDEPTTGLDPQARHLLWDRLKELKRQGLTILLTTHFMDEAERLCDRVAILDHGQIKALDAPQALIAQHINAEVIEIYGDELTAIHTLIPGWQNSSETSPISHFERSGETIFCYVREPKWLIAEVQKFPSLRYLHRPANLEDVFLRLTGRDLRE